LHRHQRGKWGPTSYNFDVKPKTHESARNHKECGFILYISYYYNNMKQCRTNCVLFRVPHQFCCCISKYIGPVGPNISTVRPSMMASLSWEAASALIFSDPPKSLQDVARWCLGGMTCMTFLSGSCWFWGEDSDYPIWIVRICSNMFKPYESRNVTNVTLLSIFVDYYAACRLSIHQSGQFLSIWEVLRGDNLLQQINFCCPL
jgi:hypothetical protein